MKIKFELRGRCPQCGPVRSIATVYVEQNMTADQLKKIRARLGLTQSQLAEKLGVSSKAVQSWEQGWRPVPGPVEKLMEIFSKK